MAHRSRSQVRLVSENLRNEYLKAERLYFGKTTDGSLRLGRADTLNSS